MDFSRLTTLLYPKCPHCGGASKSAEETDYDRMGGRPGSYLRTEAARGHSHPYMQAFNMAWAAGNEVYKRLPGKFGGLKRCTKCPHEFH